MVSRFWRFRDPIIGHESLCVLGCDDRVFYMNVSHLCRAGNLPSRLNRLVRSLGNRPLTFPFVMNMVARGSPGLSIWSFALARRLSLASEARLNQHHANHLSMTHELWSLRLSSSSSRLLMASSSWTSFGIWVFRHSSTCSLTSSSIWLAISCSTWILVRITIESFKANDLDNYPVSSSLQRFVSRAVHQEFLQEQWSARIRRRYERTLALYFYQTRLMFAILGIHLFEETAVLFPIGSVDHENRSTNSESFCFSAPSPPEVATCIVCACKAEKVA